MFNYKYIIYLLNFYVDNILFSRFFVREYAFLLVFCKGQGHHAGLVHYYLGILFSVLVIIHVARRFKVLIKGIKSKK